MAYIGSAPTTTASRKSQTTYRYLCTAGQTVFSGADLNNNTLSCDPLDTEVFMNGLKLDSTDTTITTTQVTLAVAAAAGDEIEVVAYRTFESADHYTKSAADARYEPIDSAYTKAEADTRYVNTTGDTVTGALTVDTSTTTNLTVDSGNYGGIQFKAAGTDTGYITSYTNGSGAESMYIGGADAVYLHTGTNHGLTNGTTRLGIDSSGRVTMPYQAYGEAQGNNGGLLASFSSGSIINWLTANHTNGGMTFSNSGRFTVPVAGRYLVSALIYYYPSGSHTAYYSLEIKKNGSLEAFKIDDHAESVAGSIDRTVQMTTIVRCAANDYLELGWSSNINASFWRGADHNKFRVLLLN